MPSRRAVFLKPPESLCPPRASRGPGRGIPDAATGRSSRLSFPYHTSEKSSANSNHCHTSKTASRKSFACHTSEIPPGGALPFVPPRCFFSRVTRQLLPDSSSFFSNSCGLFCTRAKPNSFVFKRFRTLSQKHPGWGEVYDCTSHSETPSGAPEPLVTCHISRSKILRDPVPARSNSLSLLSPFCGAWFFPANLRPQGQSRL